jgi:hypothetical protein
MTGGLLQVVAKGVNDIFLTSDPQITFFKTVYRRHTNFSRAEYNLRFTQELEFGKTSTLKIQKYGDLLHKLYLVVNLPDINIVYRSLTVGEVKSILAPFNITWITTKSDTDTFDSDDFQEVSKLINATVIRLNLEIFVIDDMITQSQTGVLNPEIWLSVPGRDESQAIEYYFFAVDYYFQYDPLFIPHKYILAQIADRSSPLPLANSVDLQQLLFDTFRQYATGASVSGFDPASFNDENLFFIYNVDTANYNVNNSTNQLSSITVFQSGINNIYGTEPFTHLDSYKIFNYYLNQNTSIINSNFDVERIKDDIIETITFDLVKNVQLTNSIYNSLQNDSKFMFYRLYKKQTGGFDKNTSWTNISLTNTIEPTFQDNFTNDFVTQTLPNEPDTLLIPFNNYITQYVNSFHTSNRNTFRTELFTDYFNELNLWAITDIKTSGLYKELITGSPTGTIPNVFYNMYFLNYIPIFTTEDIPSAIYNTMISQKNSSTNPRATNIQNIIDQLMPILYATRDDIINVITPLLCVGDDFTTIEQMNSFKSNTGSSGDIVLTSIIRQGEFVNLNGIDYIIPEYVIQRYITVLNDFKNNSLPNYDNDIYNILLIIVGLFSLSPTDMLSFTTYKNLGYNSNPIYKINTLNNFFCDAISSIWLNIFKGFVSNYNNLYDNQILGTSFLDNNIGAEILKYKNEINNINLNYDPLNPSPINYYFSSINNNFQSKLPVNNGDIGIYLSEKIILLQSQLIHFNENFRLLNMKTLIIPRPQYYFAYFKTVLDFITLYNIEVDTDNNNTLLYAHKPHNNTLNDPVLFARDSYLNPSNPNYDVNAAHNNAMDIFDYSYQEYYKLISSPTNPFNPATDPNKYGLWIFLWTQIRNRWTTANENAKYLRLFGNISPEILYQQISRIDLEFDGFSSEYDVYNYQNIIINENALLFTSNIRDLIVGETVTETANRGLIVFNVFKSIRLRNIDLLVGDGLSIINLLSNSLRGGQPASFAWIQYLGHFIIKYISIFIGDQCIDTHSGEILHLLFNFNKRRQKLPGYYNLIGHTPELYTYNNKKKSNFELIIPLKFFCCNNIGSALPIVALPHTDITIKIELRPFNEVAYYEPFTTFTNKIQIQSHIIAEYIFLENEERTRIVNTKHELLIENTQYNGDLFINKNSFSEEITINGKFYFTGLVKEIIWVLQNVANINGSLNVGERRYFDYTYNGKNPAKKIKVKFASRDREPFKDSIFYNYIVPYSRYNSSPDLGINSYTFSLQPNNNIQPTGAVNLGRLDDSGLEIILNDDIYNDIINKGVVLRFPIYSTTYQFLRVISGMAGVAFFY